MEQKSGVFMTIREQLEQREHKILSPYASFSDESKGRAVFEEQCDLRPVYQRDRDRILHSKTFRRLKGKTQVFLAPEGDHYRTRMTHTLEVSQNARTVAKALMLNEDLTEAIALGHDLGHTPFGHAGERVLNVINPAGFRHQAQSIRVVECLEKNGEGLNLTWEVKDGILNHSTSGNPSTLEGKIVRICDKIAYVNHDIDDAVRAGLLSNDILPKSCIEAIGATHGERINTLVLDILQTSSGKNHVEMSGEISSEFEKLRQFLFDNLYYDSAAKAEEGKAEGVIERLYYHYLKHVSELPPEFTKYIDEDGPNRIAADYIACMTDRYSISTYKKLFIPKSWNKIED